MEDEACVSGHRCNVRPPGRYAMCRAPGKMTWVASRTFRRKKQRKTERNKERRKESERETNRERERGESKTVQTLAANANESCLTQRTGGFTPGFFQKQPRGISAWTIPEVMAPCWHSESTTCSVCRMIGKIATFPPARSGCWEQGSVVQHARHIGPLVGRGFTSYQLVQARQAFDHVREGRCRPSM